MGKCSGLKGGGHHRKAIDIADKKRNEKKARKKDAEAAGKRYLALQEMLSGKVGSIYQDCDIYLEATSDSDGASSTELCRAHFRTDNCSNRRCKFSHDYTIAEALQNIMSGSNNNSNEYGDDNDDYAPTIPALRYLPGIIGDSMRSEERTKKSMETALCWFYFKRRSCGGWHIITVFRVTTYNILVGECIIRRIVCC